MQSDHNCSMISEEYENWALLKKQTNKKTMLLFPVLVVFMLMGRVLRLVVFSPLQNILNMSHESLLKIKLNIGL